MASPDTKTETKIPEIRTPEVVAELLYELMPKFRDGYNESVQDGYRV